ncbi:MAG: hypothetical protein Q7T16_06040 [Candidatus Burarchaeum sp.]|nr:hypothetical protein [Candidatus Burarchaeum sp.]MDO8340188.1 hypothetical protein [Candidatus Burarchaeum sp.]
MTVIDAMAFAVMDSKTRVKTFIYSIGLFIIFATPTALISNPIIPYIRMIPATPLDYVFLATTSILAAVYLALPNPKVCKTDNAAAGGGFLGFLSISCPTCIMLFVFLFGFDFMFNVVNPLRPLLGILSVAVLLYAINGKWGN